MGSVSNNNRDYIDTNKGRKLPMDTAMKNENHICVVVDIRIYCMRNM